MLALRVADIVFPQGGGEYDLGAVVVIRAPKTRSVWRTQFVLVEDMALVAWLKWWCAGKHGKDRVFGVSMVWWGKALRSVCAALGVGHVGYTLGSLRSGGATKHFRRHGNLGYLQYLGRWRSARTLESYLQTSSCGVVTMRMTRC